MFLFFIFCRFMVFLGHPCRLRLFLVRQFKESWARKLITDFVKPFTLVFLHFCTIPKEKKWMYFTIFCVGTRNRNSIWSHGEHGDPTSQSLNINHNSMGRNMSTMVILCNESASAFQEEKFLSPKSISCRGTGSPGRQDCIFFINSL